MKPSLESNDIVFIGGGISSLTAAYYLEKFAKAQGVNLRISIFEQGPNLGGKIQSIQNGEFLVESGPDSIATRQPAVYELIEDLGITADVVAPKERRFAIMRNSKLQQVDLSLLAPFPRNVRALLSTDLVSFKGKLRACLGGLLSFLTGDRIFSSKSDIDLASYFRKKWGAEMLDSLLGPLFSGLYGGDLSNISRRVLQVPQVSLRAKSLPPYIGFKNGISSLINALAANLGSASIYLSEAVEKIKVEQGRIVIGSSKREFKAQVCVLTTPAQAASSLLAGLAPEAASLLKYFKASDAAIVSLGFSRYESKPEILDQAGSGVIIPDSESKSIRGITLSSRKWVNRSAEGQLLVRIFGREGVFERLSKEAAIELAKSELDRILSIRGELVYSDLHLWPLGSAQCGVGHREKVLEISKALKECPGVFLLGAPYGGIGIGDCIASARRVAQEVLDYVEPKAATST